MVKHTPPQFADLRTGGNMRTAATPATSGRIRRFIWQFAKGVAVMVVVYASLFVAFAGLGS